MANDKPWMAADPAGKRAAPTDVQSDHLIAMSHLGFAIVRHRTLAGLTLLTLVLSSLIFEPIGLWPIAFVCLVPWCVLVGTAASAPRAYFYSYLFGATFYLWNMTWMIYATGVGYVALSLFMACYFPLIALPIRHAIRRRRMPLGLVLPIVWTAGEIVRGVFLSGFPWFFLSHSQTRVLTLIQISDVVGAYGVSFVVAAVNGMFADMALAYISARRATHPGPNRRRAKFSIINAAILLLVTIVYGQFQLRRDTTSPGPRIATIQGDYVSSIDPSHDVPAQQRVEKYLSLMRQAASYKPDLILLPESVWPMFLNPEARDLYNGSRISFEIFSDFAREHGAYVVVGAATEIPTPYDLLTDKRWYNSAYIFHPEGGEPDRYDKCHLVYFGEVIPFREGRLRPLYFWLNSWMPFAGPDGRDEFSFFRGDGFHRFTMAAPSLAGETFAFGVPICYEDVMPYISRQFVSGGQEQKRIDFLFNISNDGWFGRGWQQPQHLAICALRAVENRVPIVRSVNTGISGFIDSNGRKHDLVQPDESRPPPNAFGYSVATINIDSRYSLYSRYGDWFAWSCAILALAVVIDYWIVRVRQARAAERAREQHEDVKP